MYHSYMSWWLIYYRFLSTFIFVCSACLCFCAWKMGQHEHSMVSLLHCSTVCYCKYLIKHLIIWQYCNACRDVETVRPIYCHSNWIGKKDDLSCFDQSMVGEKPTIFLNFFLKRVNIQRATVLRVKMPFWCCTGKLL